MRPDSDKNRKLIEQFPFIRQILAHPFDPQGGTDGIQVDDLTIKVERADGDLMYRQARNDGLGEYGFSFTVGGPRDGLVGRRLECVLAVDKTDHIVDALYWPKDDVEQRGKPELYASAVMWATRDLDAARYANPIWAHVRYLVWLTVEAWHETGEKSEGPGRFGALRQRSMNVIVCREPEGGFEKLERSASVVKNLRLTSDVIGRGICRHNDEIIRACGMLDELCHHFGEDVFFAGMKDVLDAGDSRRASGQFGATNVFCDESGGDDRIELRDSVCRVVFRHRLGINSIFVESMNGTIPQIRVLVRGVIRGWNHDPVFRLSFKRNTP